MERCNFFSVSPSKTNILLKAVFRKSILSWYYRHKRDLPWRKSNDPYVIWLSEIILQQTRVNQGLPYFQKFVKNYPSVQDLANAPEDQVMKDWEGLGYYSRARNLHAAAKHVSEDLKGDFPTAYEDLLKLKGVGSYTAAAISSFAAGEARAVLDGNVFRVLSRYCGIDTPINTGKGKKEFEQLANDFLDMEKPADYNQGIMEFGAMQCVPKNPDCEGCVLKESCVAYANETVDQLPVKEKKMYDRQRYFTFLYIEWAGKVAVEQRTGKDVWNKLFQFPLIESTEWLAPVEVLESYPFANNCVVKEVTDLKPHKLSHQTLHCRIVAVKSKTDFNENGNWKWVNPEELDSLAFPKPLRSYLDRKQLTLPLD